MGGRLYYEDINPGDEWKSQSRTVTEADVVNFAGLSGDFNPLHIDDEFGKKTIFKGRIAHGLLGISIASGLGSDCPIMATMAFLGLEWKFLKPIMLGDTVTLITKVNAKRVSSSGDRGIINWGKRLVNQKGELVQEGETITMVEMKNK